MILAQQIDQEISELRSVFEGHREEMLSLLETAPQVQPANPAHRNPIEAVNVTVQGENLPLSASFYALISTDARFFG